MLEVISIESERAVGELHIYYVFHQCTGHIIRYTGLTADDNHMVASHLFHIFDKNVSWTVLGEKLLVYWDFHTHKHYRKKLQ